LAHDSLGARLAPQYAGTGAPSDAADLSEVATYAATYGNYAAETSTARGARTGSSLWAGLMVTETDTNLTWLYTTGWQLLGHGSLYWRGDSYVTLSSTFATAYTAIAGLSVAATTIGGRVKVRLEGSLVNANSGAARTAQLKLLCDGTQVGDVSPVQNVPFISAVSAQGFVLPATHTPAAGSHTWTVQGLASIAAAVQIGTAFLSVEEFL
jgi:hypothetical protein